MTILFTYVSFCRYVWEETPVHILSTIDDAKYTSVQIPKKNGVRTLCYPEPHSPLANYQERLLRAYLEKEPLPHCVKGFVKGSNYRSYMESHIGAKFFLRIDIKDFFPSITQNHIDEMVDDRFPKTPSDDKERIKNLLHKLLLYEGRLPQGACTSPAISNLVMTRLDLRIQKYCRRFKVEYTRYADDLLFSSKYFDFKTNKWFLKKIEFILRTKNFYLNRTKIKFSEKNEISLNGHVISEKEIRLSRRRFMDVRHMLSTINSSISLLQTDANVFLQNINNVQLKYRDLSTYPFKNLFQLTQYLCGYRSYYISWIDQHQKKTAFQKELQKEISALENVIVNLGNFLLR